MKLRGSALWREVAGGFVDRLNKASRGAGPRSRSRFPSAIPPNAQGDRFRPQAETSEKTTQEGP